MKQLIDGKTIKTESIDELEQIVKEYNINPYYANWHVKDIKEFIEYCKESQKTSIYNLFVIEFSYDNKIYWIGLDAKNDSYGPIQLYHNPKLKKSILIDTMTFKEASEKWGLDDSTLRKLVNTDKVIKEIDVRKSGSTWLITKEAMLRVYGEPKN